MPPHGDFKTVIGMGNVSTSFFPQSPLSIWAKYDPSGAREAAERKSTMVGTGCDCADVYVGIFGHTMEIISIGRVIRVLRPIHTLRMLPI